MDHEINLHEEPLRESSTQLSKESVERLFEKHQKYPRETTSLFEAPPEFLSRLLDLYKEYGDQLIEAAEIIEKDKDAKDAGEPTPFVLQGLAWNEVSKKLNITIEPGKPMNRTAFRFQVLLNRALATLRYLQLLSNPEHTIKDRTGKVIYKTEGDISEDDMKRMRGLMENPEIKSSFDGAATVDENLVKRGVLLLGL